MLTDAQRDVLTCTEEDLYNMASANDLPKEDEVVMEIIVSLADTRLQLAEARRDAERIGFAIHRGLIVAGMPLGLGWVYTPLDECAGGGDAFKLTQGIRDHIDAARAAEEAR